MSPALFKQLMQAARPFYKSADPAHSWDHICRVLYYARQLAKKEKADLETVSAAVLFHDCVKLKLKKDRKDLSSQLSAQKAEQILKEIKNFPKEKIAAVKVCIYEHSFSLGIRPRLLESKILQDADRLDSIGAISIARIFANCGTFGGKIFSWEDPFCKKGRKPDVTAFGTDWLPGRLMKLQGVLNTKTAQKMAVPLCKHLRAFEAAIKKEIFRFPSKEMLRWEQIKA